MTNIQVQRTFSIDIDQTGQLWVGYAHDKSVFLWRNQKHIGL